MELVTALGSLFTVIGSGLLLGARRLLLARRAFLRGSLSAVGEIVELIDRPNGAESSYFPRVRFRAANGGEITFESNMGANTGLHRVGDLVTVRYRPERPAQAEIATPAALWGPTFLLSCLGAVFLLIGLGALGGCIPA